MKLPSDQNILKSDILMFKYEAYAWTQVFRKHRVYNINQVVEAFFSQLTIGMFDISVIKIVFKGHFFYFKSRFAAAIGNFAGSIFLKMSGIGAIPRN